AASSQVRPPSLVRYTATPTLFTFQATTQPCWRPRNAKAAAPLGGPTVLRCPSPPSRPARPRRGQPRRTAAAPGRSSTPRSSRLPLLRLLRRRERTRRRSPARLETTRADNRSETTRAGRSRPSHVCLSLGA